MTTKPDYIIVDGKLYLDVNVVVHKKEQYNAIKELHDKDNTESQNPKATARDSFWILQGGGSITF